MQPSAVCKATAIAWTHSNMCLGDRTCRRRVQSSTLGFRSSMNQLPWVQDLRFGVFACAGAGTSFPKSMSCSGRLAALRQSTAASGHASGQLCSFGVDSSVSQICQLRAKCVYLCMHAGTIPIAARPAMMMMRMMIMMMMMFIKSSLN